MFLGYRILMHCSVCEETSTFHCIVCLEWFCHGHGKLHNRLKQHYASEHCVETCEECSKIGTYYCTNLNKIVCHVHICRNSNNCCNHIDTINSKISATVSNMIETTNSTIDDWMKVATKLEFEAKVYAIVYIVELFIRLCTRNWKILRQAHLQILIVCMIVLKKC